MIREETVTYLEMSDPAEVLPAGPPAIVIEVRRVEIACPELNRFFYTTIGGDWYWVDRLPWTYQQWHDYASRPCLETWAAYAQGTPAGYFELETAADGAVEIAMFGVLPQFIGRGIGGFLLTFAIERAWQKKPPRVWLHTSSFDHRHALQNYLARGFRIVRRETSPKELPDIRPGPWPGADRPCQKE